MCCYHSCKELANCRSLSNKSNGRNIRTYGHIPSPATLAPEYENMLPYMMAPRSPIYNYTVIDHHGIMRLQSPMDPYQIALQIDELFQNRWRTLLSVDDLMMDVVAQLDKYKN